MIFFETVDLLANKLNECDFQRFYEICNQEFILRWMNDWNMDLESVKSLIKYFITGYDIKDPELCPFVIAIRSKNDDKLIGICGFGAKEELGGKAEICYFIDENYSNKGYMKQIVPEAIKYYFNLTKKDFISALVDEDNIPSKKLLVNNGFSYYEIKDSDNILKSHYRLYRSK